MSALINRFKAAALAWRSPSSRLASPDTLHWLRRNRDLACNLMRTSADQGHGYDNFAAHAASTALNETILLLDGSPQP